jgi:L,D-transpeptidase catalytic domain
MLSISWLPLQKQTINLGTVFSSSATNYCQNEETASLYDILSLQQKGLSMQAFEYAYKGYRRLLEKKIINKQDYLTICDFSQSSNNKRLYLVDMVNSKIILNTYVAHGRNSGGEYATRFSNRVESLQSSLGFYVTQDSYYGEHGLSLRVTGLEEGYNDKASQRNIVIHGADYIGDKRLRRSNYMGRSYGCPAIPRKECKRVINMIKNGSCIFIYHPSTDYLHGSKILNG